MVFLSLLAPLATLLRSDMTICLLAGFTIQWSEEMLWRSGDNSKVKGYRFVSASVGKVGQFNCA